MNFDKEIQNTLKKIQNGVDIQIALEEYAKLVKNKLLHPILEELKKTPPIDINAGREEYQREYIDKYKNRSR